MKSRETLIYRSPQRSAMFKSRQSGFKSRQRIQEEAKLIWIITPEECGSWHHWHTKCGNYRVSRSIAEGNDGRKLYWGAEWKNIELCGGAWDSCELHENGRNGYYPKHYSSLESALLAIQRFHSVRSKLKEVLDNSEEVLREAQKLLLANRTVKS